MIFPLLAVGVATACGLLAAAARSGAAGSSDQRPEIAAVSITAQGPTLVYGAGFAGRTWVCVRTAAPSEAPEGSGPEAGELAASLQRVLAGNARLPEPPAPDDPAWRPVAQADDNILLGDTGGEVSPRSAPVKVLYIRNGHGVSRPYVLNRPEVWGLWPRRPVRGEPLTVWGVNLGRTFALAPAAGPPTILKGYQPYNLHSHRPEGQFVAGTIVPEHVTPGRYRLFSWAGFQDLGWSDGLDVEVVDRPAAPGRPLDVRDFGARGDGVTDDTAALRAALAAAEKQANPRVRVPAGRFVLSQNLVLPPGVGLYGISREVSILAASPDRPIGPAEGTRLRGRLQAADVAMVTLASDTTLADLTLDVTAAPVPMPGAMIVHLPGGRNVTLSRVALVDECSRPYGEYPDFRVWNGLVVTGCTEDLVIERSRLATTGVPMTCWPSHNVGVRLSYNTFTTADPHCAFELLMPRTLEASLIEGNVFVNGGRAKTEQTHVWPYPSFRNCYRHNIFRNNRKGDGEILMHETGALVWFGRASGGDATHVRAPSPGWPVSRPDLRPGDRQNGFAGYTVILLQGRGVGQFRRIRSNTADTLEVAPPWRVVPDATTELGILWGGVVESLFIGNDYFDCHYYSGIYGSGVRTAWVNEVYESVGGGTFLWPIAGARVMALNLIYGSKFHERAGIVITNDRRAGHSDRLTEAEVRRTQALVKCFGNEVRGCSVRHRSYVSTENGQIWGRPLRYHWARYGRSSPITPLPGTEAGITIWDTLQWAGWPEEPELDKLPSSTRWNLLADNMLVRCPVGIRIGKAVEKTILWGNSFYECAQPVQDLGRQTVDVDRFVYAASSRGR